MAPNRVLTVAGTSVADMTGVITLMERALYGPTLSVSVPDQLFNLFLNPDRTIRFDASTLFSELVLLSPSPFVPTNYRLQSAAPTFTVNVPLGCSCDLNNLEVIGSGNLVIDQAIIAGGAVLMTAPGNITIGPNGFVGAAGSGDAIVLAAGGNFINNAGSAALDLGDPAGRWLIYSNTPGGDSFGDLDSGNTAVWNATYASLPPASVPLGANGNGSRYVFAFQPTLTFTSTGTLTKTYGQDSTAAVASSYTVSGYQGVAHAFSDDASVFSGAPVLSSAGSGAAASVTGSPYSIAIANGTLASLNGYIFAFANNGTLTVNPAILTYTADAATRLSEVPNPPFTGAVTGFVNSETQATATTGTLLFTSPGQCLIGARKLCHQRLGSFSAANYIFVQASANATALTVNATPNNPPANNPSATDPPSQVSPPNNNPPNSGVNITFQPGPGGIVPISFTPPPTNVARTPTNDVSPAGLPDGVALATNNGLTFLPISQFDPNQYSQFKLPGYEGQAGEAAVFTMIARGVDPQNAAGYMIDKFWNGTSSAWRSRTPRSSAK